LEAELSAALDRLAEGTEGLVRAGAGLPLVFGRAVRDAGRKLVLLLPAQGAVPAMLPARDRAAAGELLVLAEHVRLVSFNPVDRHACVSADEQLIESCQHVVAVWDGSPSNGRDATAHLVAFARARGIPVEVIWPSGAARADDFAPVAHSLRTSDAS
jgi:sugar/nucleoside kinase (ribokinase family)